ncbi:unnamed protein product [Closterium sp. NIES-65]|nr:unnamed protein product [Closterium sp. NIES-65]
MATASIIACSARAPSSCLAARYSSGGARRVSLAGRVLATQSALPPRKEAEKPKAVDPEIVEAGKEGETGPRSRDADVARSADVAGDADMDLEALARELNMDLKEVQEAERMFESAMSAVASLESLSAKFDQMILETAAAESAESEDSRKGLRGVLGEGGLENAGLEGLERGMKELVKEIEAASSRVSREGISKSGEGSEEADDEGADVDLAGEAIADMENDLAELQRSVAATLAELDRTATSLTPELGLQEVLKLKSSISADVAQIEQQTGAILGLLREAQELQEASQQPGAPMGARQLAAQRAVEARNAMAAMAGSAEAAAETLKALEQEGAADWDGMGGVKGEAIRRAGEEVKRRRGEEEGGGEQDDDDDDDRPTCRSGTSQPAYLPQRHEVAADRAELKKELADMLGSNALVCLLCPRLYPPLRRPAYLPQRHEVAADRAELKKELAEMLGSNALVCLLCPRLYPPLPFKPFSSQPAYLPQWHEVAADRAELKREPAEMLGNAPASVTAPVARGCSRPCRAQEGACGDVQQRRAAVSGGGREAGVSPALVPLPCPVVSSSPTQPNPSSSQPAYLPQWHEVAAERAELKRELAEMFSNAVQLFQEGDEEGAMALVAANEAEVMGQVVAGEAGVEQSAVLLALSQLLLGMGEEAKGRQQMDQRMLWMGEEAKGRQLMDQVTGDRLPLLLGMGQEGQGRQLMDQVRLSGGGMRMAWGEGWEVSAVRVPGASGDGAGGQGEAIDGLGSRSRGLSPLRASARRSARERRGHALWHGHVTLLSPSATGRPSSPLSPGSRPTGLSPLRASASRPAREHGRHALALVASHPSEPLLDDLLENAGDMYYGMEMWDESIKMYRRAVNVQRELAGGEHYLQASTLCSLANALMEAQRHEEAEEVQRRAAELYEAARGERSRGVATMLVRLTQIQMEGGRVEEAEGSILRAKDILIEKEGLTSMEAAIVEFTLAQVRQAQGRPDLAVGVLESGLRIFEQSVEQQRRKGEAGDAAELAGAGAELAWGDDELAGTPRALVNALGASAFPAFEQAQIELSMLYDILDRDEDVRVCLKREAPLSQGASRGMGPLSPGLGSTPPSSNSPNSMPTSSLPLLYPCRDEDACAIREKLLSAKELAVGPLSPALVPPLIQLAQSRLTIGQSEGAERLLRRALQIARSAVPAGDARLAVPIERLALCLAQMERFEEAEMERFEEAEVLAREHLMIAEGAVEKAGLRGDTVEMLGAGKGAPEDTVQKAGVRGDTVVMLAQAQRNPALILMATGRAQAAELGPLSTHPTPPLPVFASARSPVSPPVSPSASPAQRNLALILIATGRAEAAELGPQPGAHPHGCRAGRGSRAGPVLPNPSSHPPCTALSLLLSLPHLPVLVFLPNSPLPFPPAQAQRNLALILMATGRAEAAELLLRKALARMEGAVGPMGDAALVIAGSLVVNLQQQGRDDEAEPLLKRLALAEAAATGNL